MAKTLSKTEALEKAQSVISKIVLAGLFITAVYKEQRIVLTSVTHCYAVIATVPDFDFDWCNGQRFVQMIINYE